MNFPAAPPAKTYERPIEADKPVRDAKCDSTDDVDSARPDDSRDEDSSALESTPDFNAFLASLLSPQPTPENTQPVAETAIVCADATATAASAAVAIPTVSANAVSTATTSVDASALEAGAGDGIASEAAALTTEASDTTVATTVPEPTTTTAEIPVTSNNEAAADATASVTPEVTTPETADVVTAQDTTTAVDSAPQAVEIPPESPEPEVATEEAESTEATTAGPRMAESRFTARLQAALRMDNRPASDVQPPATAAPVNSEPAPRAPRSERTPELPAAMAKPVEAAFTIPEAASGPAATGSVTQSPLDAPAASAVASSHITSQIAEMIVAREADLASGPQSFEMMLDPPELGRLFIQMNRGTKGLEVRISAEDDRVSAILQTSGGELQQALQSSDLSFGQFQSGSQSSSDAFQEIVRSAEFRSPVPAMRTPVVGSRSNSSLNVVV